MFKNKLILLSLFFISCNVVDSIDVIENETTEEIKEKIPQQIYPTSIQNHEWNDGFFNQINDLSDYGGTSNAFFLNSAAYFDFEQDGDYDLFVTVEYFMDAQHEEPSIKNYILRNDGRNETGKTIWTHLHSIIDTQPSYGYRKIIPADFNNDGFIDFAGFVAQDGSADDVIPFMGGLDIYYNQADTLFKFESVVPFSETKTNYSFFHSGTAGDVNGDGWVDIIAGGSGTQLYLNDNGTFKNERIDITQHRLTGHGSADVYSMELFDINQDGILDLIAGAAKKFDHDRYYQYYTDEDYAKHTEIYLGKSEFPYFNEEYSFILEPDYNFSHEPDWKTSNKTYMGAVDYAINDYDGDGDYDMFVTLMREQPTGEFDQAMVSYYENIDNENWIPKTFEVFGENQWFHKGGISYIKLWDIDKDGDMELLIENTDRTGFSGWDKGSDGKLYHSNIK